MKAVIKKKMLAWLDDHQPSCPICQNGEWNIAPNFLRLATGTGSETTKVEVLFIAFSCVSCGYVFLVDPGALGIKAFG